MIAGEKTGPLSRAELGLEAATGAITGDDYVWKNGMKDWTPGGEVPELAALFAPEPPPPPQHVPAKKAPPSGPPPSRDPGKLPEGPAAKGKGMMEFDTGHFRLADLP